MKTKITKKSSVTRLTVARLYNLGNYEHIRYEITAEIPRGGSPKQTLMDTLRILACLKPVKKPYDLESKIALLKKDSSELSESEKDSLKICAEVVGQYQRLLDQHKEALVLLDDIGGTSVHKDAKDTWDDTLF